MAKEKRKIEVAPYDSRWPELFELEAHHIQEALGENCTAIHHVGSTSVPGLAAKPKIDIIAVVRRPEDSIQSLKAIGFDYRGEFNIPLHYGFSKRGEVSVNLHVYQEGNPEIELNLTFRDYLRNHPEIRDEYARLKYALLEKESSHEKNHSMFTGYNLGKNALINKILKRAGFQRLRFVICTHYEEWEAAKSLRNRYYFDTIAFSDLFEWTLHHQDHIHFVLYKGIEIVGYAHIQLWPHSRAAIRILVIEEKYRRQGFGRQFLRWIEEWLKSKGCERIHTEASPDSVAFYQNQEYLPVPFYDPDGYEKCPQDTSMGKILIPLEAMPSDKLLHECAKAWDLKNLQFIRKMENIVFSCDSNVGKTYLRLTSPLRRSKGEIKAEIDWIEHLTQSGLNLPHILPAKGGSRIISLKEGNQQFEAVVFTAMTGTHPSKEHVQDPKFLKGLGRLIAKMHQASILYEERHLELRREEWFEERGLRHALQAAAYSKRSHHRARLEEIVSWMKELPRTRQTYGLVHADLGALNLFIGDDNSIGIIDFDDCCYHWFVFDLAIVIFSMASRFNHKKHSHKEQLWLDELLKGYQEIRHLTQEEIGYIPKLIFFACLRLFFWIEYHETLQTFHEDALQKVADIKKWAEKRIRHCKW